MEPKSIATADQKASEGFSEFRFDDGALIQVSAYGGQVVVLQQQASTQGRGAAFLTPEQAGELATAISAAETVATQQRDNAPAATPIAAPAPVSPGVAQGLSATDIAAIVRQTMAEELAKAKS